METTECSITLETLGLTAQFTGPTLTKRDEWECNAWVLFFRKGDKTERFDYYMGIWLVEKLRPVVAGRARFYGGCRTQPKRPDPLEVLHSISRDYVSTVNVSFENWCSEFGYDTDSKKAEEIYNACRETGLRLLNLISVQDMEAIASLEF